MKLKDQSHTAPFVAWSTWVVLLAGRLVCGQPALGSETQAGVPVQVSVSLQGAARPSPAGWQIPLVVGFYLPGADVLRDSTVRSCRITTEKVGDVAVAQVPGVPPGTYDVAVSGDHTLLNLRRGVRIAEPAATLDMDTLPEGNACPDDRIDLRDFGVMASSWRVPVTDPNFAETADFDDNAAVDFDDLALLTSNWLDSSPVTTMSRKHRALCFPIYESAQSLVWTPVHQCIREGILVEYITPAEFARNVNDLIESHDMLMAHTWENDGVNQDGPRLDHLDNLTAQELYNAFLRWKAAGRKFYFGVSFNKLVVEKVDVNGSVVGGPLDLKAGLGLSYTLQSNTAAGLVHRCMTGQTYSAIFGNEEVLDAWRINDWRETSGSCFSAHGDNTIRLVELDMGEQTAKALAFYKDQEYCIATRGAISPTIRPEPIGFRYLNAGIIARRLIGNKSHVKLALDCSYARKVVSFGLDADGLSNGKDASYWLTPWINGFNGRKLEIGIVGKDGLSATARAYYADAMANEPNVRWVSHSWSHLGYRSQIAEESIVPASQTITLSYPARYSANEALTTVTIKGGAALAMAHKAFNGGGWKVPITSTQYGYDNFAKLKFHPDLIGQTIQVMYTPLYNPSYPKWDEQAEWVGSVEAIRAAGLDIYPAVYLTGGFPSLHADSIGRAEALGITLVDHTVPPCWRAGALLAYRTDDGGRVLSKVHPLFGFDWFDHWEELAKKGYSPNDTETAKDITGAFAEGTTTGYTKVACIAHGFNAGDYVILHGTDNYDGQYQIMRVATSTFEINADYVAEDAGPGKTVARCGIPQMLEEIIAKCRTYNIPFAGYGHDKMFSETTAYSLWGGVGNTHDDWRVGGTYQAACTLGEASIKAFYDRIDQEGTHYLWRSEYAAMLQYCCRYLDYDVQVDEKDPNLETLYIRNRGPETLSGLTFRIMKPLAGVAGVRIKATGPDLQLPLREYNRETLFFVNLVPYQKLTVQVRLQP